VNLAFSQGLVGLRVVGSRLVVAVLIGGYSGEVARDFVSPLLDLVHGRATIYDCITPPEEDLLVDHVDGYGRRLEKSLMLLLGCWA